MSGIAPALSAEPPCLLALASQALLRRRKSSQPAASFPNSRSQDRWPQLKALHRGRSRSGTDVKPNARARRSTTAVSMCRPPTAATEVPHYQQHPLHAVPPHPASRRTAPSATPHHQLFRGIQLFAAPHFDNRISPEATESPISLNRNALRRFPICR